MPKQKKPSVPKVEPMNAEDFHQLLLLMLGSTGKAIGTFMMEWNAKDVDREALALTLNERMYEPGEKLALVVSMLEFVAVQHMPYALAAESAMKAREDFETAFDQAINDMEHPPEGNNEHPNKGKDYEH